MAFSIDISGSIWRVTFSGTLTSEDIYQLTGQVEQIEKEATSIHNRISDLRELQKIHIAFSDISYLVKKRREVTLLGNVKNAILTSNQIQFGFARMFQTMLDHPQITVRVFTDEVEALRWLSEKETS